MRIKQALETDGSRQQSCSRQQLPRNSRRIYISDPLSPKRVILNTAPRGIQHHILRRSNIIPWPIRHIERRRADPLTALHSRRIGIGIQIIHEPHIRLPDRPRQPRKPIKLRRSTQQPRDIVETERNIVKMLHALGFRAVPKPLVEAVAVNGLRTAQRAGVELGHFAVAGDHDQVAAESCAAPPLRTVLCGDEEARAVRDRVGRGGAGVVGVEREEALDCKGRERI